MLVELLAILGILIGGSLVTYLIGVRSWGIFPLGFITGSAVYIAICFTQLILSIPLSSKASIILTVLLPTFVFTLYYRKRQLEIKPYWVITSLMVTAILVLVFREANLFKWSADSYQYIQSGSLFVNGNYEQVSANNLIARLLGVPFLHAPALTSGEYYLRSITPILGISVLGTFIWIIKDGLSKLVDKKTLTFGALIGVILLLTNNRFIFNSFYINGHMLFAAFLLILVGTSWLLSTKKSSLNNAGLIFLQAIIIPALVVTRPEACLVAFLAILPTILNKKIYWKLRIIPLITLALSIIAWQGFIIFEHIDQGILFNKSVFGTLIFGVLLLLSVPFLKFAKLASSRVKILLSIELTIWLALAILSTRDPHIFIKSTTSTIQNQLLGQGSWGLSFVLLAMTAILVAWYRRSIKPVELRFPITAFIPTMFVLAYLREGAYRIGPGDSLNRMLLHILPILVLYALAMALRDHASPKNKRHQDW